MFESFIPNSVITNVTKVTNFIRYVEIEAIRQRPNCSLAFHHDKSSSKCEKFVSVIQRRRFILLHDAINNNLHFIVIEKGNIYR